MRIKLIDETEAPWRERGRALEAERDRAVASAATLKREADQLKAATLTLARELGSTLTLARELGPGLLGPTSSRRRTC